MRTALFHRSVHVPESGLSPALTACVICGSGFAHAPIARIQKSPDVHLLRCPKCYACSASRMPTVEVLAEYYAHYFQPSATKITHDSPTRFARHIASFVRDLKPRLEITDFGGGDGTLAYTLGRMLLERGCSSIAITVVDYAEPVLSRDERITIRSVRPGSPLLHSDVILASAVLEHVPEPWPEVTGLFAALNPAGILYVRTPAVAGFMRVTGAFGQDLDFTFPAHLHDFGQHFWENILGVIPCGSELEILHSAPSLVETDFRRHPWHTLAAYIAKAPWHLLGRHYTLVGGWEAIFRRR